MANPPTTAAPLTPQAAINNHATTSGASNPADQAIVTRVESAIAHSPMGWLQGLLGESSAKADSDRSQAEGKVDEMQEEVRNNQSSAPADAGAPPTPAAPTRPQVTAPQSATTGGQAPGAAGRQGAQPGAQHPPAGGAAPGRRGGGADAGHGAAMGAVANASTDDEFRQALDAYPSKSQETLATLSRIKQVGDIARGFQGQLDTYVSHGEGGLHAAFAGTVNFLGVGRNVNAIWDTNPYRQSNDTLGHIMTGLSAIKQVTGIVGSICGKLGLILTVVGLLGMIFPPIGTAVSGIARVLNVVGIICDAISFVLSGILVGLNGVRLAKQIAAGGSAEEKAATADLMVSEANDAAGSAISLAMAFGPKFMKGLMDKSKGVLNGLFRQARALFQRGMQAVSGRARSIATRLMRSLGMGGVRARLVQGAWQAEKGMLQRAGEWVQNSRVGRTVSAGWNLPGRGITRAREYLMGRYGNASWARGMERFGASAGNLADRFDPTRLAERMGSSLGNVGAGGARATAAQEAAEAMEKANLRRQAEAAAVDAQDLERRRIQYELQQRTANGGNPKRNLEGESDFLHHGGRQTRRINRAGREASEEVTTSAAKAEQDAAMAELRSTGAQRRFNEDPDDYMRRVQSARANQQQLEREFATEEGRRRALLQRGETNLSDVEKEELRQLNTQLTGLDRARARAQTFDQQMYSMASGGKTQSTGPSTVGEAASTATSTMATIRSITNTQHSWESKEGFDFSDPLKWDKAGAKANAAGRGGRTEFGQVATDASRQRREDFHAFVARSPAATSVAAQVRSMLGSVGQRPRTTGQAAAPATPATTTRDQPAVGPQPQQETARPGPTPTATDAATTPAGAGPATAAGPTGASPTQAASQDGAGNDTAPAPAAQEAGGEGGDDAEAIPYWPKLLDPDGEGTFASAVQEFGFMRRVAVEFKRAQLKGKQEAVDTLETYGRYQEYAAARASAAQQHQGEASATGAEAQGSQAAAGESQQQGEQGAQKQAEARGQSNVSAPDLPEPESRGFWARIIGRIKRWAKAKAAQIFGWLQEKIASVILRGLCGVSMGDMRDYAGALRRQQQAAQGVANTGAQTAGQAANANIKLQGDAAKEAQGAVTAIAQCDQNIADADSFLADVANFEQQVRAAAAAATQFISAVHQEWQQQRDRAREQQGQGDAGDAATPAPDAATETGDSSGGPEQDASAETAPPEGAPDDGEGVSAEPGEGSAASEDVTDVKAAASYVASAGDGLVSGLQAAKSDYSNQLTAAGKTRSGTSNSVESAETGANETIAQFQAEVTRIKEAMGRISGMSEIPAPDLSGLVESIVGSATELDSGAQSAHASLTRLFEQTYTTIQQADRGMVASGMEAINDFAAPLTGAVHGGIDHAQAGADAAWDATANVVSRPANWIADNVLVPGMALPTGVVGATALGTTAPAWGLAGLAAYDLASPGESPPPLPSDAGGP